MKKYGFVLIACLLVCLILHKEKGDLSSQSEPNELQKLDKKAMSQVAQLRKDIRLNKSENSSIKNVEEYGPNLSERLCVSSICYSGMVKEFVIDREDSNIFVLATETGGAWVSYNRGRQWEPIDDDWSGIHLNWVSQDAKDPNIFYFSAGTLGLFEWDKSKNEGLKSWVGQIDQTNNTSFDYTSYIKNDLNDPNVHYLATELDIYKFENNKYSLFADSVFYSSADFEVVPDVGLVSSNVKNITVLREDGSRTIFNTGIEYQVGAEIAYSPSNPNIIYSWSADVTDLKMFRTIDGGYNWSPVPLTSTGTIQTHDQTLEIHKYDETSDIILFGAVNLFMAIIDNDHIAQPDFKNMITGHGDYHGTLMHQDTLYEYTDGGLFAYDKNILEPIYDSESIVAIPFFGVSLSKGLNTVQTVDAVVHPETEEMAMGLWHNGSWHNRADGTFNKLHGGDGFQSAFHPTNPKLLYSSTQRNVIYRNDLITEDWDILPTATLGAPFRTKLFVHPNYPEDLFFINHGLLRVLDASTCISGSCQQVGSTGTVDYRDYGFDNSGRTNSAYIFSIALIDKIPSLTNPVGKTIYDLSDFEDFDYNNLIIDIFVSATEEVGTLYVLIGGASSEYIVHKMLSSQDDSVEILESYTITFPENVKPINLFLEGLADDQCLFGTQYGLFSSKLIDGEFAVPEVDLPNVEIRNIRYEPKLDKLFFATYGRGVWTASPKHSLVAVDKLADDFSKITAFPNPVSDILSVTSDQNEVIYLLDINGRILRSDTAQKNVKLTINLSNISSGVYFIKGSNTNRIQKFVKL